MQHRILLLAACFLFTLKASAQDTTTNNSTKTNPVIYADFAIGPSMGSLRGLGYGGSLNYQIKKSLITARISGANEFESEPVFLAPIIVIPVIRNKAYLTEYALLYGLRSVKNGHSFSASVGVSQNYHSIYYRYDNGERYKINSNYIGLPFEFNVLFFKGTKKPYRLFYIIPIGPPTGLGRSIGFKFSGNISKHSYATIGLTLGWGFHKQY